MVRALALDEVAVWFRRTESLTDAQLAALDLILSNEERARRDRLAIAADRRDFTAAHGLLRHTLSRYGDLGPALWSFEAGPHGKPSLPADPRAGPSLSFNLAHTRGLVACAVVRGADVGVDVERRERASGARDVAEGFFAADEVRALDGCDPEEYRRRFLNLWTLKEAYVKARGVGLTMNQPSFACLFDPSAPAPGASESERSWSFWLASLDGDGHLAVAVAADRPRVFSLSFRDADGGDDPALQWSSALSQ
jgi:4'-phosphopantetheinyl transferase